MPPLDATPLDSPPASSIQPNPDYVPAYQNNPTSWRYDIDQGTGLSRATYYGEVFVGGQAAANRVATQADIAASTTGVSSFNTRSGAVTLLGTDITSAGGALLAAPVFTGVPQAPTAAPGTNTAQLATCSFVTAAVGAVTAATVASFNGRVGAVSLTTSDIQSVGGALTASPAFTGNPTGPTQSTGNASSSLATTQFVSNALANAVVSWNGRTGAVAMTLSDVTSVGGAPINSPVFTGTPVGTTAAPGTSSTQLATCAFVTNAVTNATTGVSSFNTRVGAVTLQLADVTSVGGAPSNSPNLTGTPLSVTPTAGDSSTKIATTAFVATAIGSMAPVVQSWNGRTGVVSLQLSDVTSVGGAPLASPTFSGTVSAPTPTAGDNSTKVATTAFVAASFAPISSVPLVATTVPLMDGTATIGASGKFADGAHIHPTDTSRVNKAGDTMTGSLGISMPAYANFFLNANAASPGASVIFQHQGSARWQVQSTSDAETGSNVGSNFQIWRYTDANAALDSVLSIARNTGVMTSYTHVITAPAGNSPGLFVTAAAGLQRIVQWQSSGSQRWAWIADQTAETGGNVGSVMFLGRWADNGTTYLGAAMSCERSTGVVTFSAPIVNGSDAAIKRDVAPFTGALDAVQLLRGVTYRDAAPDSSERRHLGFVAQDVEAVLPEAVYEYQEPVMDGEAIPRLGVAYSNMVPVLVEAIKELTARLAAAEATIADMRS